MKKRELLALIILFTTSQIAYSAPINLPSNIEGLKGKIWSYEYESEQIEVSAGIETDFVTERELDKLNAKAKGNLYTAKLLFSSAEKFDFYVNLGQAQDIKYKTTILGSNVKFDLEDEFVWGVGVSYAFTSKDDPLQIGIDGKYRQITDMDYESVTIDGTTYSKSQLGGKVAAKWREWQVALLVGKKFNYFIPYAGVKYSDVAASAKAIVSGTTYDLGSTDSESKVGIFVGCSITPTEQFSIDLQGRFIDEEAFTVRATYKF